MILDESARPPFDPRPTVLEGDVVRLEPLHVRHVDDLHEAGRDPSIWRYMAARPFADVSIARAWVDDAIAQTEAGTRVAFAQVHRATGRAVGSTSYLDLRRRDRGLEIGWTWIAPEHQRTPLNTEAKLLLMTHAFEDLGAVRVAFKTDARNERSQRAIARVGGVREGVLRRHYRLLDDFVRDSVYFSVLDDEWPAVKARLAERLARTGG